MKELLTEEEIAMLDKMPTTLLDDCRLDVMTVGTRESDVVIKHFITPEELRADMKINPLEIENSMIELASHYARYTHLLAKARLQKDDAEARLELLEAKLDKSIRDAAARDPEAKKLTEPMVAAQIKRQTSYIKASLQFNEARAVYQVLEGAVAALDKKSSMIVQLNKNASQEYEMTSSRVPTTTSIESAKERLLALQAKKSA